MQPEREYASEQRAGEIGMRIIRLLDGLPIGNALYVLDNARAMLLDSHLVDADGDRFMQQCVDIQGRAAAAE